MDFLRLYGWLWHLYFNIFTLAEYISDVPILGEYLSAPFFDVADWLLIIIDVFHDIYMFWLDTDLDDLFYDLSGWVIRTLRRLIPDLELLAIDFPGWIMSILGAEEWEIIEFYHHFWAWLFWKMGFSLTEAWAAEENILGWWVEKITELIPGLELLGLDPFGWLITILGGEEWEAIEFYGHFLAWLLWKMGMSITEALLFENDLGGWLIFKLEELFPSLGVLLTDPPGWVMLLLGAEEWELIEFYGHFFAWVLWKLGFSLTEAHAFETDPTGWVWLKFMDAVDRYIDAYTPWLVNTCERVLNTIWQMRL